MTGTGRLTDYQHLHHQHDRQCFMCCENKEENLVPASWEISQRFCLLISGDQKLGLGKGLLISCRECVPVIESFCFDFDQFCKLKLQLSSDLRRISDLLKSSINNKQKKQEKFQEEGSGNTQFESQLLRQCESFFCCTKNLPFLELTRCHPPPRRNGCETETVTGVDMTGLLINPLDSNDDELEIIQIDSDVHDGVPKTVEATTSTINEDPLGFSNNEPEGRISISNSNDKLKETKYPLKCRRCPELFETWAKLKQHEKSHSDVRRYACRFCERRFKFRSDLKRHIKSVHKMNSDSFDINDEDHETTKSSKSKGQASSTNLLPATMITPTPTPPVSRITVPSLEYYKPQYKSLTEVMALALNPGTTTLVQPKMEWPQPQDFGGGGTGTIESGPSTSNKLEFILPDMS